jgi:hypothetical protein
MGAYSIAAFTMITGATIVLVIMIIIVLAIIIMITIVVVVVIIIRIIPPSHHHTPPPPARRMPASLRTCRGRILQTPPATAALSYPWRSARRSVSDTTWDSAQAHISTRDHPQMKPITTRLPEVLQKHGARIIRLDVLARAAIAVPTCADFHVEGAIHPARRNPISTSSLPIAAHSIAPQTRTCPSPCHRYSRDSRPSLSTMRRTNRRIQCNSTRHRTNRRTSLSTLAPHPYTLLAGRTMRCTPRLASAVRWMWMRSVASSPCQYRLRCGNHARHGTRFRSHFRRRRRSTTSCRSVDCHL